MIRLGQFVIPLKNMAVYPALVKKTMGKCIILNAKRRQGGENNFIHYIAECDDFDLISEGDDVPCYRIIVVAGLVGYRIEFVKDIKGPSN